MPFVKHTPQLAVLLFLSGVLATGTGCRALNVPRPGMPVPAMGDAPLEAPRELYKAILPTYTIEPPDILTIDAIYVMPKSPYHVRTHDSLTIEVSGTLPDAPLSGLFLVQPDGIIDLGLTYGTLEVADKTVKQIKAALTDHLKKFLKEPVVSVSLNEMRATQQIAGQHLVTLDGSVTLGGYGSVQVVGMTLAEAKKAIEDHLSEYLDEPEVAIDVFAYNSKVYYVITQGAGQGDGVFRFPITGNETVLDAIAQINGLSQASSKRIWIARPTHEPGNVQMLPVSWDCVTAQASIGSNYQILPGDRIFIAEDRLVAFSAAFAKLTAPLEQIVGFALLGTGGVSRFSGNVLQGGGNSNNNF